MTELNNSSKSNQKVPGWVGIALVVVCVVAGGLFIWWVVRTPLAGGSDFIPDANGPAARPRAMFRQARNESIRKTSDNHGGTYQVRGGDAIMDVELTAGPNDRPRYTFHYREQGLISKPDAEVLQMKYRILADDAVAKYVGLSNDQRQKLSKISTRVNGMDVSRSQRRELAELWENYHNQKNNGAKAREARKLVAALKKTGDEDLKSTRAKANQRVTEIKSILTAQQIKKFEDMK